MLREGGVNAQVGGREPACQCGDFHSPGRQPPGRRACVPGAEGCRQRLPPRDFPAPRSRHGAPVREATVESYLTPLVREATAESYT